MLALALALAYWTHTCLYYTYHIILTYNMIFGGEVIGMFTVAARAFWYRVLPQAQ